MGDTPAPLVSVIIPCHNYGRYLADAVESALAQTYEPIEVLIVDDGSDDDTAEIAAGYTGRVEYLHKPNGGLPRARNTGAAHCRGELVAFLDADDRLDPRYVEACVESFRDDPTLGFVYTQVHHFGAAELVTRHPDFDMDVLKVGNYVHATALIRTELVRRFGYDPSLSAWEDWNFYLTLAEHGYRGRLVDEALLHYRRSDDSMAGRLDPLARERLRWAVYRRHRRLYSARFYYGYGLKLARAIAATRYRSWRRQAAASRPSRSPGTLRRLLKKSRSAMLDLRYGGLLAGAEASRFGHLGSGTVASTDYAVLGAIFSPGAVQADDILVDVGCGKGRVINWWLHNGYRNPIYGLELDPEIAATTGRRLRRHHDVTVVAGNAIDNLPVDGTLFYLYNPFGPEIVKAFKRRLEELHPTNGGPRVVYYCPDHISVFGGDPRWTVADRGFESEWKHKGLAIATLLPPA